MSKTVVLAEKPSVGRDIARVLKCTNKGNGYLEGNKFIVTWALGHLVTLADPEAYGDRYKSWKIEDLPIIPSEMKLTVIKQTGKQYQAVKQQLSRKDVTEIIIATDAGREGELVARWIIEKSKVKKPLKRLWISSVTDKAITEGFQMLKDGRAYENLYKSAVARSEADWIVGINATRALTVKYNAQLSCGRVQSPTLAIIALREEEIKAFSPRDFFGITAYTGAFKLIWQDRKTKDIKTFDREYRDMVLRSVQKKEALAVKTEKSHKKKNAPLLYNLTELQRDANIRYSFSAKDTLSIMQRLYENYKILTYPRTDSRYLSTDIVGTLKDRIDACGTGPYRSFALKAKKMPVSTNSYFVDNTKISDHHAIIPTEQKAVPEDLNSEERKIYDLVVRRFLSVFFPPFEYEQTTVFAEIGGETFVAKGKITIAKGWKEIYSTGYEEEDELEDGLSDQELPNIKKGESIKVSSVSETSGKTKPPARFNEASLLSAMENPGKYMESKDRDLIKTLGETGGLGTVATRADIIEKLFNSFLVEKNGREIFITSKGEQLLNLVPEDLKSPELTAVWEQKLGKIAEGKLNMDSFVSEMKKYAIAAVNEIKNSSKTFTHTNLSTKRCPTCGKALLEVKGKKGEFLVCQDRECGYRERVLSKKELFYDETKQKKQGGLSKKEIHSFLKDQDRSNEKLKNTALADALSKIKDRI